MWRKLEAEKLAHEAHIEFIFADADLGRALSRAYRLHGDDREKWPDRTKSEIGVLRECAERHATVRDRANDTADLYAKHLPQKEPAPVEPLAKAAQFTRLDAFAFGALCMFMFWVALTVIREYAWPVS